MELNSNRAEVISRMQSRMVTIDQFNWDKMMAPPLYSLITQEACNEIHRIATSVRYSGNARKRYELIDNVLKPFGFEKKGAGTNRVVYKYLENDSFLLKVATDAVGIGDNPREFKNQFIFKPFVTKIFEVDPTGAVALIERVVPITSREEFLTCASNVYDVIRGWFIGNYVLADIGTKFFMNWGIRRGFGPVLLDFPYVYELDGNKLFCNEEAVTGLRCGGEIDYDDGYNFLYCSKCGKQYRVQQLAKAATENKIIMKGRASKMKIQMTMGGHVVSTNKVETEIVREESDCIKRPRKPQHVTPQAPVGKLKISAGMVDKPAPKINKNNNSNQQVTDKSKNQHDSNGVNNRGIVRSADNIGGSELTESKNDSKIEELEAKIAELEAKNKNLEQELGDKSADLNQAYDDYDAVEKQRDEAAAENKKLEAKIAELEAKVNEPAEVYEDTNKITELENKLQEANILRENDAERFNTKIADLEKQLESNKGDKDHIAELGQEIVAARQKTKEVEKERDDLKKLKDDLEYQLNDLKNNRIKELVVQLEDMKRLKEAAESQSATISAKESLDLKHLKEQYEALNRQYLVLEKEKDELESHLEEIDAGESENTVDLPISSEALLREEGREEYTDAVNSADGINALVGELTTINTLNLSGSNELIDEDQYVIAITTDDGEFIRDPEGNVLCIYRIDNVQVPEVFMNEDKLNDTASKVQRIKDSTVE